MNLLKTRLATEFESRLATEPALNAFKRIHREVSLWVDRGSDFFRSLEICKLEKSYKYLFLKTLVVFNAAVPL